MVQEPSFSKRLDRARELVRKKFRPTEGGIEVTVKRMERKGDILSVLERVDHFKTKENDGLIFTPEVGTIKTGTQSDLFKWKPPHMHTVDLWLRSEPAKNPDPSEFEDFEPDPDPDHMSLLHGCLTVQVASRC